MARKPMLEFRVADDSSTVRSLTATMRISSSSALGLPPVVLGHVEHDAVDVFELLFCVDAGIAGQLHEELAAVLLDPALSRDFVLDHEADVMEASPIRTAFAAFGSVGEMQQREIHDAVRERDGVSDRAVHLVHALEVEDALVEGRGFFEIGDLDGDVSDLPHGDPPLND